MRFALLATLAMIALAARAVPPGPGAARVAVVPLAVPVLAVPRRALRSWQSRDAARRPGLGVLPGRVGRAVLLRAQVARIEGLARAGRQAYLLLAVFSLSIFCFLAASGLDLD
jgi:hypothetical protein